MGIISHLVPAQHYAYELPIVMCKHENFWSLIASSVSVFKCFDGQVMVIEVVL